MFKGCELALAGLLREEEGTLLMRAIEAETEELACGLGREAPSVVFGDLFQEHRRDGLGPRRFGPGGHELSIHQRVWKGCQDDSTEAGEGASSFGRQRVLE